MKYELGDIVVGILSDEEWKEEATELNIDPFAIEEAIISNGRVRSNMDIFDNFCFGIVNIINQENVLAQRDKIGIFLMKDVFYLIDYLDEDQSTRQFFNETMEHMKKCDMSIERFVTTFFNKVMGNDQAEIEQLEYQINQMEDELMEGRGGESFNPRMMEMKKKLLVLHTYYEQIHDIVELLEADEISIMDESRLWMFRRLDKKIERLSNNTQLLRESLVQLRDAHQAAMDFRLNNTMKLFTVVTTIFLPLTLIAGWYGMNFNSMPELDWKYGYLVVILLSIVVVVGCLAFFKKKKYF